jgi:hypothetical protein
LGKTNGMQQRVRGLNLASWVTRPIPFATAVSGLGLAAFAASLLLPVGVAAVALGVVGAVTAGAGLLTLAVLGLSRVTGLERRSERAIEQGRDQILFAGSRPPEMYIKPRPLPTQRQPAADVASDSQHIDLTESEVPTITLPQGVRQDA